MKDKHVYNNTVGDREHIKNQKTCFHHIQQDPGLHIKIKTKQKE
jgi:hypothetical protein